MACFVGDGLLWSGQVKVGAKYLVAMDGVVWDVVWGMLDGG